MAVHRLRAALNATPTPPPRQPAASGGFVCCPVPLGLLPGGATFIHEVYRLARQRTEEELRRQRRALPGFSVN